MAQTGELSSKLFNVSHIATRLLAVWRSGERAEWVRQVQMARRWAAHSRPSSTLEMERMEVLSGALESLGQKSRMRGAIRLLEQLAAQVASDTPGASEWPLLPGTPGVVRCSQFVH